MIVHGVLLARLTVWKCLGIPGGFQVKNPPGRPGVLGHATQAAGDCPTALRWG
jgi:hypothetical protein